MSIETVSPVLIHQPDLAKLSKPTPTILSPKNVQPNKISAHSPNKKNYVTVKKFNSSLATIGSDPTGQKLHPKMQFIQQAALSNLPDKYSSIPVSPKNRHRRSIENSKNIESKQFDSTDSKDDESSMSRLVADETNYSPENQIKIQDDLSDNSGIEIDIDNNNNNNFINYKNMNNSRKRKGINCSHSFDVTRHLEMNKICSSFSFSDIRKKVSRSHSNYNHALNIMTLPKNYSRIQTVSSKISLTDHTSHDQKITIQFTSNWGNPKTLILSTISILDENRKSIPINTISSVPDLPDINLLEKFTDFKLVKDESDIFTIDYDLSIKEKFSLILTIDKSAIPRYVRIWNPNLKDKELLSASIKNVTIYLGSKKIAEGEIPQNFGVDIEFESDKSDLKQYNSSLLIDELFPSFKIEEKISDVYGAYPFCKAKKISIEILNTFKKSVNSFENIGLNGIDFYDDRGSKITMNDIDLIAVKNIFASTYANPKNIVRESMKTCCMDYQFLGNYLPESIDQDEHNKVTSIKNPLFIFTFIQPIAISLIRVWNFNAEEGDLDNGIKSIVVRNNDRVVWCGKIKKGVGLIKGIERSITNIWLTDSMPIRDKISKHFINDIE